MNTGNLRTAQSCLTDAKAAAKDIHAQLMPESGSTILFFCSSQFDLDALRDEINRLFAGHEVMGCTTAGEIGPQGYLEYSLSAACLPSSLFTAVTGRLDNLRAFNTSSGDDFARQLALDLQVRSKTTDASNTFGFLLIDGLSVCEETVVSTLHTALGAIPLIGGSAGDDMHFRHTQIFHDGSFHSDSAVLMLATTSLPFRAFMTHHYRAGIERLLVTEADTKNRTVIKLNNLPAAREYARLIGIAPAKLTSAYFAASPMVATINGTHYVRSIQKLNPDGSLTFYCAIEEGMELRATGAQDLVENLRSTFGALHEQLDGPILTLLCDCALRRIDITQRGTRGFVENILKNNNSVGFSTYGEQFNGIHINQTLTGIAFGWPRTAAEPAHEPATKS